MTPLRRRAVASCLLPLAGALLLACSSEAPRTADAAEATTFNVSLAPVGGSGIQGLTTVSPGGGGVTLKLELMGLESGRTYGAALLSGTCQSPGDRVADLESATSGAIGIGSSVTPVDRSTVRAPGRLHIEAYLPDGTLAACGDIPEGRV